MTTLPSTGSEEVGVIPPGVEITPIWLKVTTNISYDEWARLLSHLLHWEQSIQWWLGDLILYGENAYGELYAQAAEISGRSVSTLSNWMWVAGHVAPAQRRNDVRWTMHREIASLTPPEQDEWLDAAEDGGWTVEELKKALRENPSADSPPRQPSLQPDPESNLSPLGRDEVTADPDETVGWSIRILVPETADLMAVDDAVKKSSEALRLILTEDLQANPQVFVAVDVNE